MVSKFFKFRYFFSARVTYFFTMSCYVVVFLMSLKLQRKSVEFVRVFHLLRLVSLLAFTERAFLFLTWCLAFRLFFKVSTSFKTSSLKQGAYNRLITAIVSDKFPLGKLLVSSFLLYNYTLLNLFSLQYKTS